MNRRIRVLILVVGLVVVGVLIARTGPRDIFALVRRIGWNVLAMFVLYAGHVAVRGISLWGVIARRSVPLLDVLRVRLSAEAVEVLTYTGPFLAEPAKGWLLVRHGLTATEAFAAVATEYLIYTAVSAALALVAFAMLASVTTLPGSLHTASAVVAVAMALFLLACAFASITGIGLIGPLLRGAGRVAGLSRLTLAADAFEPVERLLIDFLHRRHAALAGVVAIETIGHALLVVEIWIVLTAMGATFAPMAPVILEGGAKIIGVAFFFVPGQVGAAEGVYAALVRAVGLTTSIGLTLALLRRLRSIAVASLGLLTLSLDDRAAPPDSSPPRD